MPGTQSMYHPRPSIAPLGGDESEFSEEEENVSPELRKATTALGFDDQDDGISGKSYLSQRKQRLKKQPWVLSINDSKKTHWDLYVMILATINCF